MWLGQDMRAAAVEHALRFLADYAQLGGGDFLARRFSQATPSPHPHPSPLPPPLLCSLPFTITLDPRAFIEGRGCWFPL